jgi:hypothetical protein
MPAARSTAASGDAWLSFPRIGFSCSRRILPASNARRMTASNSNCGTSAFALPRIDRCPLLPPFLVVRGAVDRATVGRTDEEAIGPWVRTAGSPESLAWWGQSGSDVDSTHRRSPLSSTCSVQPSQVQGRCVVELSRAVWRCVRWRTHIGLRAASPRVPPHVVESRSSAEPPPGGIAG